MGEKRVEESATPLKTAGGKTRSRVPKKRERRKEH